MVDRVAETVILPQAPLVPDVQSLNNFGRDQNKQLIDYLQTLSIKANSSDITDGGDIVGDVTLTGNLAITGDLSGTGSFAWTGNGSFSGDLTVADEAYGVGWNGSLEVPTKNAVYDKIETLIDADLAEIAALTRTRGDLIVGGASAWTDLALGGSGSFLGSNGTDVVWRTAAQTRSDLSLGTAALVNTGTSGGTVPLLNAGATWDGRVIWRDQAGSAMATATAGLGSFETQAPTPSTGFGAFISFHRPSAFAAYLGIDSDNLWKVGGWSMGANAYRILHEGLASGTFTGAFTWSGAQTFSSTATFNGPVLGGAVTTFTADGSVGTGTAWAINDKAGSALTLTLPSAATYPGRVLGFKSLRGFLTSSASSNVLPIGSTTPGTTILTNSIGEWGILVSNGSNWVKMAGS